MAKGRGKSAWNRKFGEVARRCFKQSSGTSMTSYGTCMSRELKKESPRKSTKKRKGKKR